MRKTLTSALFVVLAILAMAVPASAQFGQSSLWRYLGVCPPGDELCRVMVGNQQMVRHMQSGYMGYIGSGGAFYGTYDPYGRPMSRLVKIAVGAGIGASIGGGIGDLFGHGREGTLIGAGIGALIGTRSGGNKNQRDNGVIVTPPAESQAQPPVYWSNGAPVAVGTRPYAPVQPVIEKRSGEFTLSNSTRFKMDVYDGETSNQGNFKFRLVPGEKRGVNAPGDRYRGLALVPNIHGGISTEEFGVSPTDAGWIFIEPDVMKGRR